MTGEEQEYWEKVWQAALALVGTMQGYTWEETVERTINGAELLVTAFQVRRRAKEMPDTR